MDTYERSKYPYEIIEYKDYNIEIFFDDDSENPRETFDNFGTMICFHSRYNLGDKHNYTDPLDFKKDLACGIDNVEDRIYHWEEGNGWSYLINKYKDSTAIEECDTKIDEIINKAIEDNYIILPLYLYDHSGITMNVSGFSCQWDSGQVGYIYISKEDARKELKYKLITKNRIEKIKERLTKEVEIYDEYLRGDVYFYKITKENEDDDIGGCSGFYGYNFEENGLLEYARDDIDHHIRHINNIKNETEMEIA